MPFQVTKALCEQCLGLNFCPLEFTPRFEAAGPMIPLTITIREAEEEDLGKVMAINRAELPENYPYGFFHFIWKKWKRYFLVAEYNGEVVGYLMSMIDSRNPLVPPSIEIRQYIESGKKVSHLLSIAVLKKYQGMGIGSGLLKEYLRRLAEDGFNISYLEVRVSNTKAIRLYEKFGYKKLRVLPFYYLDGEDAYLMVKEIDEGSAGGW